MRGAITDMQQWKREHSRPVEGWLYAMEDITRANIEFTLRMMFVWPRVFMRLGS